MSDKESIAHPFKTEPNAHGDSTINLIQYQGYSKVAKATPKNKLSSSATPMNYSQDRTQQTVSRNMQAIYDSNIKTVNQSQDTADNLSKQKEIDANRLKRYEVLANSLEQASIIKQKPIISTLAEGKIIVGDIFNQTSSFPNRTFDQRIYESQEARSNQNQQQQTNLSLINLLESQQNQPIAVRNFDFQINSPQTQRFFERRTPFTASSVNRKANNSTINSSIIKKQMKSQKLANQSIRNGAVTGRVPMNIQFESINL